MIGLGEQTAETILYCEAHHTTEQYREKEVHDLGEGSLMLNRYKPSAIKATIWIGYGVTAYLVAVCVATIISHLDQRISPSTSFEESMQRGVAITRLRPTNGDSTLRTMDGGTVDVEAWIEKFELTQVDLIFYRWKHRIGDRIVARSWHNGVTLPTTHRRVTMHYDDLGGISYVTLPLEYSCRCKLVYEERTDESAPFRSVSTIDLVARSSSGDETRTGK